MIHLYIYMKKSSPAWSLRSRRSEPQVFLLPGPGAYSPNDCNLEASPKYRIGKSSRLIKTNSINPGPGAYDPKDIIKSSPRAV